MDARAPTRYHLSGVLAAWVAQLDLASADLKVGSVTFSQRRMGWVLVMAEVAVSSLEMGTTTKSIGDCGKGEVAACGGGF